MTPSKKRIVDPYLLMESNSLSEAALATHIQEAQAGSAEAFGKIYDHFFESIYRFVSFRLPDEIAEDVVAEIFVKAWEKIHTYKSKKNIPFGAWLFRIARHSVIDTYRKQKGWEEVSDELPDQDALNKAETAVKRRHLLKMVRGAMDKLPNRYRDVLHLSYIAELPNPEVARVMRTSEGSVRILKFRALKKLEGLLPDDAHDEI